MEQNGPGDRNITIVSVRLGSIVRLSVQDVGCGLPTGEPEQIFKPFFTTKSKGLGLGLGICRSILTAYEGRLWAEPNQGRGTILHLELGMALPT